MGTNQSIREGSAEGSYVPAVAPSLDHLAAATCMSQYTNRRNR